MYDEVERKVLRYFSGLGIFRNGFYNATTNIVVELKINVEKMSKD